VYTNIFIYDKQGIILAVSSDSQKHLVGKQLDAEVLRRSLMLKDSNSYCVSDFEKTKLYNNDFTYIYYASVVNNQEFVGGIGVVFDSKVEFKAMIEESIPNFDATKSNEIFGVLTTKNKMILSSSNPSLQTGDFLSVSDKFFDLKKGESYSEIVVYDNKYYALGVKCSQGYREYKTSDNYDNEVYALFFSYISQGSLKIEKKREIFTETPALLQENSQEIATFYIGGKWLGVPIHNVLEAVSMEKLIATPTLNNHHPFKGTMTYNNKAVAVIDIKNFIDEPNIPGYKEIVIVKNFDENSDTYLGILVNSLGDIPEVSNNRIKAIDNHILGSSSLITSIVMPLENIKYDKLLSLLDLKKLKNNLVKE
jgi:chemotaxis signal transduction protein